jgi:hypothetical protein
MASTVDLSQLLRCTSLGSAIARTSALVVLDCGCNIATLRLLWERCSAYRVVADGAANGLLDGEPREVRLSGSEPQPRLIPICHQAEALVISPAPADARDSSEPRGPLLVPDAIAGDCDSIRPEVAVHFRTVHSVPLLVDEDQDCHDMVKCVRAVQAAWRRSEYAEVSAAVAASRRNGNTARLVGECASTLGHSLRRNGLRRRAAATAALQPKA